MADLTDGYAPKVSRARRGLAMLDRNRVLVQDEVQAPEPVEIVWNFHTRAKIEVQESRATLTQGKAALEARILSPKGAAFEVISANPPAPQRQQPDVHNLVIRLAEKTKEARLAVLLTPAGSASSAPALEPLDAWISAGKLEK